MADRFGYSEIGFDINPCWGCEDYDAWNGCKSNGGCGKPITNYDRIISKTPEELAVLISESIDCGVCEAMHGFRMCDAAPYKSCEDCWLDWLKQEVKDNE